MRRQEAPLKRTREEGKTRIKSFLAHFASPMAFALGFACYPEPGKSFLPKKLPASLKSPLLFELT